MPLKICAITSTRADWGLLAPVLALVRDDPAFDLAIIATGQHVAAGGTADQITAEGFDITLSIDMAFGGDTPLAVTSSLAAALNGFGAAFAHLRPDLLLVLGDRYEILGGVAAAALATIPVAHIAGGDVTEGAVDDSFRHAITKMSHLHFVTTDEARRRVLQLGEDPQHVFLTGSPGLDRIRATAVIEREAFFDAVGLPLLKQCLMVTFHPETLAPDTVADCREMLTALDRLDAGVGMVFSGVNADVAGGTVGDLIGDFVRTRANAVLHTSLGSVRYFSALAHVDAVIGNSSSGLYEAPSFATPTVNIGDRQKGRPRAASVIDVSADNQAIYQAIQRAMNLDCTGVVNPYGDGYAAEKIVAALKACGDPKLLVKKRFVNRP